MAVLKILRYPDPGLSQPCKAVESFDDALRSLADDLLDTMRAAPGVGITAAHVGIYTRLVVLELSASAGPLFYVNPEIVETGTQAIIHTEGSVSMPGATEEIERPAKVRLRWQDLSGAVHEDDFTGFHAVCLQHEIDQLDGLFWLRRLSRIKRDRVIKRWQKSH
jgi:peptide deformylase